MRFGRLRAAVASLALATALGAAALTWLVRPSRVRGESMAPGLHHGDVVLVLVVPGIERWVEPGDVVLARVPGESGEGLVIKRVVAETGSPHAPRFELRGDDPQRSRDSRHYGPIGTDQLAGRVLWRLYPWPPGPPGRSGAADSREPAAR